MKKYALIVGISRYSDPEITDLSFAAQDARDVAVCLREVCRFDDVRLLASGGDREPDHVNTVDALHNIAPLVSKDDLFLFYFAGHGIHTKTGAHLLASNSRIHMPELASLSMNVLADCLAYIEAGDRVLILDACRNDPHKGMGDADNVLTAEFGRDVVAMARTPVEGVVPATCVLFSCSEGERAYEWPDQGHGAFTHYLLEGLRGAAFDAQRRLTVQSLGRYVEEQVPRWARKTKTPKPQTPWGQQLGSWREIVLAGAVANRKVDATSPPRKGHIEVVEQPALCVETVPTGAKVSVDGRLAGTAPVRLTLPAGQYHIRAEKDGYKPWERRIRFDALGDADLRIELQEQPRILKASFPMTAEQAREVQHAAAETVGRPLTVDLDCGKGAKLPLVLIPTGKFLMGSPQNEEGRSGDEGPQHEVTISRPFYMGRFPVTQAQYEAVMGENPSHFCGKGRPVECVQWDTASEFCVRLTQKAGRTVCLPTEAQWEYVCRAGDEARFGFGDDDGALALYGWYAGNSHGKTHPAGQKKPNAWGLHDMHGNVLEWCADWYGSYRRGKVTDPRGPDSGTHRVARGGSWDTFPENCRSAYRTWIIPDYQVYNLGFRVVYSFED
jgi:formylglycine-generating enzyme required for sulfatase activity